MAAEYRGEIQTCSTVALGKVTLRAGLIIEVRIMVEHMNVKSLSLKP
jgi:hypothetical protein